MTSEPVSRELESLTLVQAGPSHRLGERFNDSSKFRSPRTMKILVLIGITWVPMFLMSLVTGRAFGGVEVPFFHDPELMARFLCVLPLLEFAQVIVGASLKAQSRHIAEMGLVSEADMPKLDLARKLVFGWRQSGVAEGILVVISYAVSVGLRVVGGFNTSDSSWEFAAGSITIAGWWYILVSLPILYFFLLRWIWVFILWGWFLFQISRIPLRLTATHPDHAGGLGFLAWGIASFGLVLMAISTVFSAGFADEILHHGRSLAELKYHVVVFVVAAVLILHLPLLPFSGQLSRCRFAGLLEFGALVWRHDRGFDEKWIESRSKESLLGSTDTSSLADIAEGYEHVEKMQPILFDLKAVAALILAALLPMCPLLATQIPLSEILMKLGEVLI